VRLQGEALQLTASDVLSQDVVVAQPIHLDESFVRTHLAVARPKTH
jgi:hypothetical protein